MFSIGKSGFVVVIDEPENHLHPSMQRVVLPNLAKAFPDTKFIVATHSPFVVSSFPEAAVYGLFYNNARRVESTLLGQKELSGTPNTILREVLDVDSNLPVWVEDRIRTIIEQSADSDPASRADLIMSALVELGVSNSISEYAARERR